MARNAAYYRKLAAQAAAAYGIDPDIFTRQIQQESGFNPGARSGAGAQGIAQIMPATAKGWGVNPNDPRAALYAAAKHMAGYIKQYGGWRNALVAYNAGGGRVGKPLYAETRSYIDRILGGANPTHSPAGVASATVSDTGSSVDPKLAFIFQGAPMFEQELENRAAATPTHETVTPGSDLNIKPGGKDYHWLQRIGQSKFGLQNDPGDSQTTGGHHTTNSRHYAGKAIDFGSGRNDPKALLAWYQWALKNKNKYGFSEVLKEDWGTGNAHIHVAF